jgi:hypothetical protein
MNDHSGFGRIERKGVPSIAERMGPFQSEEGTLNYLLSCNMVNDPVCLCGRPNQFCLPLQALWQFVLNFQTHAIQVEQNVLKSGAHANVGFHNGPSTFQATLQLTGMSRQTTCNLRFEGVVTSDMNGTFGRTDRAPSACVQIHLNR